MAGEDIHRPVILQQPVDYAFGVLPEIEQEDTGIRLESETAVIYVGKSHLRSSADKNTKSSLFTEKHLPIFEKNIIFASSINTTLNYGKVGKTCNPRR